MMTIRNPRLLSILKQPIFLKLSKNLINFKTPSNLNYWAGFGPLAGICLVIQKVPGVFLAMRHQLFIRPQSFLCYLDLRCKLFVIDMANRTAHPNQVLFFYSFLRLFLIPLIFSRGYVLMGDLWSAVNPFLPDGGESSLPVGGGFNPPPGPSGSSGSALVVTGGNPQEEEPFIIYEQGLSPSELLDIEPPSLMEDATRHNEIDTFLTRKLNLSYKETTWNSPEPRRVSLMFDIEKNFERELRTRYTDNSVTSLRQEWREIIFTSQMKNTVLCETSLARIKKSFLTKDNKSLRTLFLKIEGAVKLGNLSLQRF